MMSMVDILLKENADLQAGYDAARQEIASLKAQPYDQQAMGLCHVCGWKGVIDYPDGPVCVACEHDKTLSPQPTAQPLHVAATSCPHEIDKDKIVLHFDSEQPGKNALAQLSARLQAAQAQPAEQTQRTGLCCRSHPHEKQNMQCQLLEVSAWLRWHASACTTPSADSMRLYADQVDAVTGSLLDAPAQAAAQPVEEACDYCSDSGVVGLCDRAEPCPYCTPVKPAAQPKSVDENDSECEAPPIGWHCTRTRGHDGPCAAAPSPEDRDFVERGMRRIRDAVDAERYRCLRSIRHWSIVDGRGYELRDDGLDSAIDDAIAAQKGDAV